MKKIVMNDELRSIMINAVDLICDAISSTLGPSGNNVIISADLAPFITNDGVTIAKNISSDDEQINSILEIIKEASLKTNDKVGDGTTTTLVILQSIFKEGLRMINSGVNPIILKSQLNKTLYTVLNFIDELKKEPTKKDMKAVASIAVGSSVEGEFIFDVFSKMKSKYSIMLDESKDVNTYYEIRKGYNIELDDIPSIYFDTNDKICMDNTLILLVSGYLDDLEQISDVLNEVFERNKKLVIFAEDYSEEIHNNILSFYIQSKNIFLFKIPDYGSRKDAIMKDIKSICDCNIKNLLCDNITYSDLGSCKDIVLSKEEITLINNGKSIRTHINKIENELEGCSNDYEKEFLLNRLSKLKNGIATIYVGGNTKTEIKEKMMRFEDAICALEAAKDGVVLGEGVSFLKISSKLGNQSIGDSIIKKALQAPFNTIIKNVGIEYKLIKNNIEENNFDKVYNFDTCKLESINETMIIDTATALKEALTNAVSISSMLLTTNYLIINN